MLQTAAYVDNGRAVGRQRRLQRRARVLCGADGKPRGTERLGQRREIGVDESRRLFAAGCGSRYGSRRGGVVEYVGHQRGNSGLVANRRKLFGRAPDEAQALKGGQGRLHLRRVRVRGEAGGNRELQLLVGQRRRGLRAVCHALGDGQPAGLIQLQLPILVVAGDQRGHGRPRRTRVGGGQPGSSACSRSRPVRAGGVARAPGVNRRCSAVVMSTNVTYMPVRRRVGHQHVRRRHPGPAGPQSEGWRGSLRSKRNEAKENSQKQGEKYA